MKPRFELEDSLWDKKKNSTLLFTSSFWRKRWRRHKWCFETEEAYEWCHFYTIYDQYCLKLENFYIDYPPRDPDK